MIAAARTSGVAGTAATVVASCFAGTAATGVAASAGWVVASGFGGTAAAVVADAHVPLELDDADTDATWTLGVCATGAAGETPAEEHGGQSAIPLSESRVAAGAGLVDALAGADPVAGVDTG
jgi:hypothetical protein